VSNLHKLQFGELAEQPETGSYEKEFGKKTGEHTHPVTHPNWMTFNDKTCPNCPKGNG
jgi:hypothetical protein